MRFQAVGNFLGAQERPYESYVRRDGQAVPAGVDRRITIMSGGDVFSFRCTEDVVNGTGDLPLGCDVRVAVEVFLYQGRPSLGAISDVEVL
jgi:hypothetical protein